MSQGGNKVLVTDELSISTGASFDLSDNDLIVDYSSVSPIGIWTGNAYNGITGYIQSGRIVSSAASGNLKKLAIAETREALGITGSQTGTFAGQLIDSTAVLVKFTWGGDANVDGKLNIDDYGRIDSNVAIPGASGWYNGDFNYDGKIKMDDYGIIDSNIAAGPPLSAAGPATAAAPKRLWAIDAPLMIDGRRRTLTVGHDISAALVDGSRPRYPHRIAVGFAAPRRSAGSVARTSCCCSRWPREPLNSIIHIVILSLQGGYYHEQFERHASQLQSRDFLGSFGPRRLLSGVVTAAWSAFDDHRSDARGA